MGSPNYLLQTPYGYYYRHKIPPDLRTLVGKTELRYSLKTGLLSVARSRARLLSGSVQHLFRKIRNNNEGNTMSDRLSKSDIQALISQYLAESLEEDAELRLKKKEKSLEEVEMAHFTSSTFQSEAREALARNNYVGLVSHVADTLLEHVGKSADKNSDTYKLLCLEITKAQVEFLEVVKNRDIGNYKNEVFQTIPAPSLPSLQPQQASPETEQSETLQEVIDVYLSEQKAIWEPRTFEKNVNHLKMLAFYLGDDFPIRQVDYKHMQGFKRLLLKLPAGFFKYKKYAGMTKDDVLNLPDNDGELIAPKTLNMYIGAVITFFNFAVRNGYMDKNFADGLKVPLKKKPQEQRDLFTTEELHTLFHSKEYNEDTLKQPYQFWLPVLALYTGARLEELCQLQLDDIKEVNGLWVLDITTAGTETKRLKNQNSERLIPLHPFIIEDLNFIGFVEQMRNRGETRLFPELPYKHFCYHDYASKWFRRYRYSLGIMEKQTKTFHSFRHTVADNLKQQMVNESALKNLLGHTEQGETYGRYGKQLKVETVYAEAVLKLQYELDLSHLKASKFVVSQ